MQQIQPILEQEDILYFMQKAYEQALNSKTMQEVPVGCVFVDVSQQELAKDEKIIARSHNLTNQTKNATQHCEIICINELEQKNEINFQQVVLFVTCEPCIMCAYALRLIGIREVYFGCSNQRFGGNGSILSLNKDKYPSYGGYMAEECMKVLQTFYEEGNLHLDEELRHRQRKQIKK